MTEPSVSVFQDNTLKIVDIALIIGSPAEAMFMCIAAASTIIAMTAHPAKDEAIVKLLQDKLAEVVKEHRYYQQREGDINYDIIH